jgi:hypothetical protein
MQVAILSDRIKRVAIENGIGQAATLAELKRGPKPNPEPMPVVNAKDLTPDQRAVWLREHSRRFG